MTARRLTKKQEAFAVAIAKGASGVDAYRQAYAASAMSPQAVTVEASRLLKRPNVALRVSGLAERASEKAALSVERTLEELARAVYADPEDPPTWGEKLSAIDKAMKHHGLFAKDNAQQPATVQPIQIQVVMVGPK